MYGKAIDKIILWLEKLKLLQKSKKIRRDAFRFVDLLLQSRSLKTWDDYNITAAAQLN
jgi:hypothetical protein